MAPAVTPNKNRRGKAQVVGQWPYLDVFSGAAGAPGLLSLVGDGSWLPSLSRVLNQRPAASALSGSPQCLASFLLAGPQGKRTLQQTLILVL